MDLQPNDKNQPHIVQIMMREHYNLQSGRSITCIGYLVDLFGKKLS